MTTKAELDVFAEREAQRSKWGDTHDDAHKNEELPAVASVLAHPLTRFTRSCGCREAKCEHVKIYEDWSPPAPEWAEEIWLRHSKRERLVIAAALILAEIERMDRAEVGR